MTRATVSESEEMRELRRLVDAIRHKAAGVLAVIDAGADLEQSFKGRTVTRSLDDACREWLRLRREAGLIA